MGGLLSRRGASVRLASWNVAAVNNNPFEYYTTLADPRYEQLMVAVGELIDAPGERDVPVRSVFTQPMFEKLKASMAAQGWAGIDAVEEVWESDLASRPIVSGFLKDKEIGAKRLASMPDRFTNTINTEDGRTVCRPTVINNYDVPMPDGDAWFAQWHAFFFEAPLLVKAKSGAAAPRLPCAMLSPIKRSKYPALSEAEEAISLPLQLLCLAIFDAILVGLLNQLSPGAWHELKMSICEALVVSKAQRTIDVLQRPEYADVDLLFLQEVSGALVTALRAAPALAERFEVLEPRDCDAVRDQNSLILVAKRLLAGPAGEALSEVELGAEALSGAPVAEGDLCVFRARLELGGEGGATELLLASFHGDTNGLASTPVVSALRQQAAGLPLLVGIDANTYLTRDPKGGKKFVGDFVAECASGEAPLAHSWQGPPEGWQTTYNARTYLQPQLNKAVRYAERATSSLADNNPKDFLLYSEGAFEGAGACARDNTGQGSYVEGTSIPTLTFPSDHCIVSTTLRLR